MTVLVEVAERGGLEPTCPNQGKAFLGEFLEPAFGGAIYANRKCVSVHMCTVYHNARFIQNGARSESNSPGTSMPRLSSSPVRITRNGI
jgi:hypothetical protein